MCGRAEGGLATGASMVKKSARRTHPPAFKAQIALTVLRVDITLADLTRRFGQQPNQVIEWKCHLQPWTTLHRWQSAQSPLESRGCSDKRVHF